MSSKLRQPKIPAEMQLRDAMYAEQIRRSWWQLQEKLRKDLKDTPYELQVLPDGTWGVVIVAWDLSILQIDQTTGDYRAIFSSDWQSAQGLDWAQGNHNVCELLHVLQRISPIILHVAKFRSNYTDAAKRALTELAKDVWRRNVNSIHRWDLHTLVTEYVAQHENIKLRVVAPNHWELECCDRCVLSIWPTAYKVRSFVATDGVKATKIAESAVEFAEKFLTICLNSTALTTGLLEKIKRNPDGDRRLLQWLQQPPSLKLSPLPSVQEEPEPAKTQPTAPTAEVGPTVAPLKSDKSRIAKVSVNLDGNNLRLVVNGSYFSDSYRLTEEDTRQFLTHAAKMAKSLGIFTSEEAADHGTVLPSAHD